MIMNFLEISGIGNLTKNVELEKKQTKKGETDFCKMSVAFNNGKDVEPTYIEFDVWGTNAVNVAKYQSKGSLVKVDGVIRNNNYEKEDGQKVYGIKFIANSVIGLGAKKTKEAENVNEQSSNDFPF